jgi:hypothetical protein
VKVLQDRQAHRTIRRGEDLVRPPVRFDRASCLQHTWQRVLEAAPIVRLLADLDVGQQPEERAAPIGASPGARAVEPAVTRAGQALRQTVDELSPHLHV